MKKEPVFRFVAGVVVIASFGFALWVASRPLFESEASSVPVAPVREGEFVVIIPARGSIQAARAMQVYAPMIPNLRIAWMAPAAELLQQGDPMIRFDSTSARQELIQKEAVLEQAEASLAQAVAEVRSTAARDRSELRDAEFEVELAELGTANSEFVSRIEAEQGRIALRVAQQNLRALEAEVAEHAVSGEARIASLTRQKEQAEAEIQLTRARLAQMEIRAPLTGYPLYSTNATQLLQSNPQPFRAGDSVSGGVTLAVIPELTTLFMDATVEEIDRGRMSVGDDVRIRIDALPELVIPARLTGISPLAELSLETLGRSFHAYAELGGGADPRLRPGMNGGMDVVIERIPDAIAIPAQALFTRNGSPVVYLMEGDDYTRVEVEVLARNPDEVAISGVPGDSRVALVNPEVDPADLALEAP